MIKLIDTNKLEIPKGFFNDLNAPKFFQWLNDLPAVDAQEIRHGKWLPIKAWFGDDYAIESGNERYQTSWKCSLCGRIELIKEPYCHCGAKMDGEEEINHGGFDL